MTAADVTAGRTQRFVTPAEERRVIFASSLGTVFEWYDFYLYATLAPFFAALFFPKGNDTAALLSALPPTPPASWSAPSERWFSGASATWSAANIPS